MVFPRMASSEWRAQVEKELGATSFERALVTRTIDGIAIEPLYVNAPQNVSLAVPERTALCLHYDSRASTEEMERDLSRGADGLWVESQAMVPNAQNCSWLIVDSAAPVDRTRIQRVLRVLNVNRAAVDELRAPVSGKILVSTLEDHRLGAEATDELGAALAGLWACLEVQTQSGVAVGEAARCLAVQLAVGRDTFVELCKLRAMRVLWTKLLAVLGENPNGTPLVVHAVCAERTLTTKDVCVNMLRTTTQAFAAIVGGADVFTPLAFDGVLGNVSEFGRRVALNTGLVLQEESALGRVQDAPAGAFFFETLTDTLARAAWLRFQEIQREGGLVALKESGAWAQLLENRCRERHQRVAERKFGIVGVSEFPNLDEEVSQTRPLERPTSDAHPFEALRSTVERMSISPQVALLTLGPAAEHRARVQFASQLFAAGGVKTTEISAPLSARYVCICGSDERYNSELLSTIKQLKNLGCQFVMMAGKPGPQEAVLTDAGLFGAVFAGCNAVHLMRQMLELTS